MPCRSARRSKDLAKLGLGLAPIGAEPFQADRADRIGSRRHSARSPATDAGCPSMHHRPQRVHARAQVGHFLGQVLVLLRLGDGEHGEMMDGRFQILDLGRLVVG
jgi:hypothetical protein